jgi:hypothetical protein
MDALSGQTTLVRALFAESPWSVGLGILGLAGAILTAVDGDSGLRFVHEFLFALATACTLGPAVRHMPGLAFCAGHLGIQPHRERLRNGQLLLLGTALTLAITLELQFMADMRAVVVPVGIVAAAVALTTLPGLCLTLVIAFMVARQFSFDHQLLFTPAGASISVAICMAVLLHWLRQVWRLHDLAAEASHDLSDAAHERANAAEIGRAHAALTSDLVPVFETATDGRVSSRRFWLGMGYDPISSWKVTGYSTLFGVFSLTAVHFLFSARLDSGAYLILCAFTAFAMLGRFNSMHEAWLQTPVEQSVLVLTPRWPQGFRLKTGFLRSLGSGLPGYASFWAALSAFGLGLGWIVPSLALASGVVLVILTKALVVLMMHYVSQRQARSTSAFVIFYTILQIVGTVTLVAGWAAGSASAALIGLSIVLVPALPTIYLFSTRRLQFPVQRLGKITPL